MTVAWMDGEKKSYKAIPIQQQVEVLSMVGDVAMFEGKPADARSDSHSGSGNDAETL